MEDLLLKGASLTEFYSPKQGRYFFASTDEEVTLLEKEIFELQFLFPEGVTVRFVGFVKEGDNNPNGIACTRFETQEPDYVGTLTREPFKGFLSIQFQNRNPYAKKWTPIMLFREERP